MGCVGRKVFKSKSKFIKADFSIQILFQILNNRETVFGLLMRQSFVLTQPKLHSHSRHKSGSRILSCPAKLEKLESPKRFFFAVIESF